MLRCWSLNIIQATWPQQYGYGTVKNHRCFIRKRRELFLFKQMLCTGGQKVCSSMSAISKMSKHSSSSRLKGEILALIRCSSNIMGQLWMNLTVKQILLWTDRVFYRWLPHARDCLNQPTMNYTFGFLHQSHLMEGVYVGRWGTRSTIWDQNQGL